MAVSVLCLSRTLLWVGFQGVIVAFLSHIPLFLNKISGVTRDFQQCGVLTSVDSDEPEQQAFKLRNTK